MIVQYSSLLELEALLELKGDWLELKVVCKQLMIEQYSSLLELEADLKELQVIH